METVVVIPVGPGREENLIEVLGSLEAQVVRPAGIVLVHDGEEAWFGDVRGSSYMVAQVRAAKHEPGGEQPRNLGVRSVQDHWPTADHVWFLDSDVIVAPDTYQNYVEGWAAVDRQRILIGPYDWMPPGVRHAMPDLHNDPRWTSFSTQGPEVVSEGKLNDGLACFSGNLVWPIEEFVRVGGFWNDLHHGRCEDGELGARAVAEGVPISLVPKARGWHLHHDRNHALTIERNDRDVPMLNARHPWLQDEHEVFVVDKDGKRFDQRCPHCGELVNTIEYWAHTAAHAPQEGQIMPEPMP